MEIITRLLSASEPEAVVTAAAYLRQGDVVVFPTDTVYGVGVDPFNEEAIEKLYTVKQRPLDKGIPILLADITALSKVARSIPPQAQTLIERFWPGPLTLIVPKHPDLPANISPNDGIAVRIPDNAVARAFLRAGGGAAATSSANLSGARPAQSGWEASQALSGQVAVILDDGPSPHMISSTIVDCTCAPFQIIRQGLILAQDLLPITPSAS